MENAGNIRLVVVVFDDSTKVFYLINTVKVGAATATSYSLKVMCVVRQPHLTYSDLFIIDTVQMISQIPVFDKFILLRSHMIIVKLLLQI